MDLKSLREELIAGDNSALKVLFEKYGRYCINGLIKKHGCSENDASDIFVDAVLNFRDKVVEGKIEYLTSAKGYIYATCLNMSKAKMSQSNARKGKENLIVTELYGEQDNFLDGLIAAEKFSELKELALRSFEQLNDSCQKVLTLFYISHYSMEEIAKAMGYASADVAKTKKSRCYANWTRSVKELKEKFNIG